MNLNLGLLPKKSICVSRCFAERLTTFDKIQEALLTHTAWAGEKLRKNGQSATRMQVFLHTSPHSEEPFFYGNQFALAWPTNDIFELSHYVIAALTNIFRKNHRYMKCGVEMTGLIGEGTLSPELFAPEGKPRSHSIMTVMDKSNQKMGRGTISFAGSGLQKEWFTKRDLRSYLARGGYSSLCFSHHCCQVANSSLPVEPFGNEVR